MKNVREEMVSDRVLVREAVDLKVITVNENMMYCKVIRWICQEKLWDKTPINPWFGVKKLDLSGPVPSGLKELLDIHWGLWFSGNVSEYHKDQIIEAEYRDGFGMEGKLIF